jgi:hypothetical protein
MSSDELYAPHAVANANTLANTKFLSACFTGAIGGVLGLQKQYGLALFAISSLTSALMIYALKMPRVHRASRRSGPSTSGRDATEHYVIGGFWEILNPGQENVFSFLLLWTLFFGASRQFSN